jgi:TRAP-type mannitol/chloroaromatic compound transport system permease small subunit
MCWYNAAMSSERDKTRRRWWQLRLWHLFALIAFFAAVVSASQHVGFDIGYNPDEASGRLRVWWDDSMLIDWSEPPHMTPQRVHGGVI